MQKQGDLLSNQSEDLFLRLEHGVDWDRVQREKDQAIKRAQEAEEITRKNQIGFAL